MLKVKDTVNHDDVRALNAYLGLSENLSNYYALDSVSYTRLPLTYLEGARRYDPIPWERVDSICESTGSDILVCMEDLQIFNEYETYKGEENWGVTDIKYFVVWRIYDPLHQKFHDERVITDSLYTEISSLSYAKLLEEKMPTRQEINGEVAYEVGRNYANLISPTWKSFTRKYFVAGHQEFSLAHYYLNNDDVDRAIEIWERHAGSEDKKLAGRSSFNLALAYELKEDFKKASHWIRKSIKTYRAMDKQPAEYKYIKEYYKELTLRTQNNYLLDKFFGKEKTE
jgi:tetratricopeptide (TPR) repeat protein